MVCCSCISWLIVLFIIYKVVDRLLRRLRIGDYGNRFILVTGCDSGFGNLITKRLDGLGCHIFAGCLTEKGEDDLRKSCSDRVQPFHLDVTKSEDVQKALEFVRAKLPSGKGTEWQACSDSARRNRLRIWMPLVNLIKKWLLMALGKQLSHTT